jgi:ribosomal protein S18 acetylase RimI-like enzyme
MRIRYAKTSDIPHLIPLYSQLAQPKYRPIGSKSLKMLLRTPSKKILVAEEDCGALCGFLEFTVSRKYQSRNSPQVVFFDYVAVDVACRRVGVGSALFRHAIDQYRAIGCVEFFSETLLDNHAAQAFHEQLGFTVVEKVIRYQLTAQK